MRQTGAIFIIHLSLMGHGFCRHPAALGRAKRSRMLLPKQLPKGGCPRR